MYDIQLIGPQQQLAFSSPSKAGDDSDENDDRSPVQKKGKRGANQDEKDRLDKTRETKQWFTDHRATAQLNLFNEKEGKAMINVELCIHPEACIEARVRRDEIHESVYQSMKTMGVGRTDVVVLVWQEDLEEHKVSVDTMPNTTASDLRYQVICGDHTVSAITRLHKENPTDPQFSHVPCEVILCTRTLQNIRFAYNLGALDNELKAMTTGITAWDVVVKIHNVYTSIQDRNIAEKSKKQLLEKEYAEIYKSCSFKYTKNTFGSLRVLGSKTGKLWDNIKRLFDTPIPTTKVPKGAPKPVQPSVGHFYHMADIPESKLVTWTDRFFKHIDPWNSLTFKKRCEGFKKTQRVKAQIREFVNIKDTDCNASTWTELVEYFPFFGDEEKVQSWVNMMDDKAKSQLISHIKTSIVQAIEAHNRAKKDASKATVPDVRIVGVYVDVCFGIGDKMLTDNIIPESFSKIFSNSACQKIFEKDFD